MSLQSLVGCLTLAMLLIPTWSFGQESKKDDSDSKPASTGLPIAMALNKVDCYADIRPGELAKHYQDWREWKQLQADTLTLLGSCHEDQKPGITATEREPVLFTVVDEENAYSWLVPQADDYGQSLKGVKSVRVVVLTKLGRPVQTPLTVTVTSTKVENPLVSQIPDFVKAVSGIATDTPHANIMRAENIRVAHATAWCSPPMALPFRRAVIVEEATLDAPGADPKKSVAIKATYNNAPWAHWGLTATAGAVIGPIHGPEKMKVDDGKYASDPLSRALTMAAVAYYPWKFDTSSPEMTAQERLSVLAGGVLTPAPGFGLAISGGIIRGLAINAGWAWMWVPTSGNGGAAGSVVPPTGAQLSNKRNSAFFLGGGYVFSTK